MSYATRVLRREVEQTEHPIGLGWLLAIALCGGILLFTAIGLLLVWWVKKTRHRHSGPRMVYGYSATHNSLMPPSSSRLIKRRLLGSQSFSKVSSRLSSRFSFSGGAQQHAVPPPLPTYEGVQLPERRRTVSRGRKRSRSWVDEDDLHGPKMVRNNKRNARDSWFGRDGRLGMAPTLPNVGMFVPESEKGYVQVGEQPMAQGPQSRWLPRSQTEPRLATIPGSPLSPRDDRSSSVEVVPLPVRGLTVPGAQQPAHIRPAHMRPSKTDPSLKGILRSTELRLSQRSSRSPVKASESSSAVKVSPTKSSCSSRTGASGRSGHGWRASGSPSKRGGSFAGSRNNSTSSIGSAANSLILAATQELELPGGASSPSRARSVHWEQDQQQTGNRSPERAQYTTSLTQSPQRQSPQRQNAQRHSPQQQSPQRQSPQRQNPQMMRMMPHVQMQAPHMKFPQMQHPQLVFPQMQRPSISHVQQQHSSKKSSERRMSVDSDKSSSLSTLYSTNEPEEEERPRPQQQQQQAQDDDPFVEKGGPRRWPSWQARQRHPNMDSTQRRVKALSVASLASLTLGEPSGPPPSRPVSAISRPGMSCQGGLMPPVIFEPTPRPAKRYSISQMPYLLEAPSEASFASVSVDSDATEVPASEMQRVDWVDSSDSASSSPTTPTRNTQFRDTSSSPYDEREIMSLLMGTAPTHRSLPLPPSPSMMVSDGSIVTILSPPPRGDGGGGLVRQASTSSSIYTLESFITAEPGTALTPSPPRRSPIRSLVEGQRLSNTVAELRRMNSMISTYSVASLASTVAGEGDSPTLPASLSSSGAGLTASRSIRIGTASIGSRHYLNIGSETRRSMIVTGSRRYGPRRSLHRRAETYHYGKENLGLGLRLSCIMDETIDVVTQDVVAQEEGDAIDGDNLVEIIEGIPSVVLSQKLTPVEQLIAAEQRQNFHRASMDSLELYDNDGFLLSSPERDAKRRGVRV
ncbi:hypothetical protein TRIATDRAFT_322024 [Trichoderma atroviride IMI 206040]|uniref:Uncharacterized protein n=1 Tax=Hypocrea atroviridis (strain ATCC 20476 / IMI 206040) TaxID=452589 RepID=G9P953_HYPAI|nr:uncharacterized protein TRIATDRAFT_322024 [Trichoderma atroviride IMI 206040]EHK41871.1 hypothetical protein TRIATDRAFT_322024 [Trichoderma atroviride IMI 206040]